MDSTSIAVGVGGGDELVGSTVEEEGGAGLLADMGIGAVFGVAEGISDEALFGAFGDAGGAFDFTDFVCGNDTVVVEGAWLQFAELGANANEGADLNRYRRRERGRTRRGQE